MNTAVRVLLGLFIGFGAAATFLAVTVVVAGLFAP
jgi:hypothetical protein